ncbi:uncharacterized protein LOC103315349 [Nasonia vitripennis]|uniref:Uncharacterized protein n=1 Tax=Nasonia vitripennis TaxID=7425 RepID=A0A7M7Q0C6_NASVI|nr:uncharacterized protein LOC103315349 [Nasonia vitripennis]
MIFTLFFRTLVAYIEEISNTETYINKLKNVEFEIKKCILNNNDGTKIQCNMYNEIIGLFAAKLNLNEKVLIRNASIVEAKNYTKGNLPFEINIQKFSTIDSLGEFQWRNSKIDNIDFNEIPHKNGYVKLIGYIYNEFVVRNEKKSHEYFGSITDKKHKLDILLITSTEENLNIELGYKIEVTGDLQKNGNSFLLKVNNLEQIKVISNTPLDLVELLQGSEIFISENSNQDESSTD